MLRSLSVAFTLLAGAALAEAQAILPEPVAQALRNAGIPTSAVGLVVQEVGAARPGLALNEQLPLNPASVMKLVTT